MNQERPTPETDAASWVETNASFSLVLATFAAKLEQQRDDARELARELLDMLNCCREDSIQLRAEWHWKRDAGIRNERDMNQIDWNIEKADLVITKAKEVLP